MKHKFLDLVVAMAFVCFALLLTDNVSAATPLRQTDSEKSTNKEDDKRTEVIRKVLKQIVAAEKKNKYMQLEKLMTESAWDEFVASKVMEASMMASPQMGGNDNILDVLNEYGIDPELPEMGFEIDMDELQSRILEGIHETKQRIELLQKLDRAKSKPSGMGGFAQMIEISIFDGDIVGSTMEGDVATVQLKPSMPELPEGMMIMSQEDLTEGVEIEDIGPDGPGFEGAEIEMGGPAGMPDFPPIALKFRKAKDSWKFDGTEMDESEFKREHPTIEDPSFTGKTVDGKEVKLEDFRGKVVLVDFWGTWCKGCIAEFPKLKKLTRALEGQEFVLVGIAQDRKKDLEKFLAKKPLPWANVIDDGKICSRFKVNVFPTTMLIDQEGNHIASNLSPRALIDKIGEQLDMDDSEIESLKKAMKLETKRVKNSAAF